MTNFNVVHTPGFAIDENTFNNWCLSSKKSDSICYYRGELSRKCETDKILRGIADYVYGKYMKGTVCLVQKRVAKNDFLYFAVRTKEAYS